jgi:hypothetical protein
MPSAIVIQASVPPTMIKLYQRPRDIPRILHALHQLGHAHRRLTVGANVDPDTLPKI